HFKIGIYQGAERWGSALRSGPWVNLAQNVGIEQKAGRRSVLRQAQGDPARPNIETGKFVRLDCGKVGFPVAWAQSVQAMNRHQYYRLVIWIWVLTGVV